MSSKGIKILVVEDDHRSREYYCDALRREGYQVHGVSSGQDALNSVRTDPVQFVLLDILMDGMDGLEVCRRIRNELRHTSLPICMITASMDMSKVVLAFEHGANGYIVKPFDLDELVRKIDELYGAKV